MCMVLIAPKLLCIICTTVLRVDIDHIKVAIPVSRCRDVSLLAKPSNSPNHYVAYQKLSVGLFSFATDRAITNCASEGVHITGKELPKTSFSWRRSMARRGRMPKKAVAGSRRAWQHERKVWQSVVGNGWFWIFEKQEKICFFAS